VSSRVFLDSPRGRPFRALRYRDFRLIFAAFLLSQSGFWITHISLQGLMARQSGNDPLVQGVLSFVLYIPGFVLAAPAGLLADRLSRKAIAIACQAGIAIATAALAWLVYAELSTPSRVLALAFGLGVCFACSGPAQGALVANSIPRTELGSAVALHSALNNLTRVAGPILAAPLLATGHFELAFALYTISVLISGVLTARLRVAPQQVAVEAAGLFRRMASGFEHARSRPPAMPSLAVIAMLTLFGVSHGSLLPVFAQQALGRMEWFTALAVGTGAGAIVGALTSGFRPPDLRRAGLDLICYGAALFAFSQMSHVVPAAGLQVLVGYFYFSVTTNLQTLVQQLVDDALRGRVMSLFGVCWGGLVPFGGLAMGSAARALGAPATIAIGASVCASYGAIVWWQASRGAPPAGAQRASQRASEARSA
jgi:MFS family permease